MAEITPRLTEILRMYLNEEELRTACWQHPKKKSWLIHHWPLMTIRRRAGIILDEPEHILPSAEPHTIVLRQRGHVAHKGAIHEAWAYGVADQENCHIPHRYPIARKRGEDVVILELLGMMHDYAVRGELYGEDEADEFARPEEPTPKEAPVERTKSARVRETEATREKLEEDWKAMEAANEPQGPLDEWRAKILECKTRAALEALYNDELLPNLDRFDKKEKKELEAMFATHGKSL